MTPFEEEKNRDLSHLVSAPREALDIEIKDWLNLADNDHRAHLAKEIIALANNGGGYIVIGFSEGADGSFTVSPNAPPNLNAWAQDAIQSIVAKYVDPELQCRVIHQGSAAGHRHPIIIVPGGTRVPVRAKAGSPEGKLIPNRIYIRRPGPNSEEPRTTAEWDQLLERLVQNRQGELLEAMRSIMAGVLPKAPGVPSSESADRLAPFEARAAELWEARASVLDPAAPPRLIYGYYDVAFEIQGDAVSTPLSDLRDVIKQKVRNHSGWPPFLTVDRAPYSPTAVENAVETWLGPDTGGRMDKPAHHDFWRISADGLMFLRRGYPEDGGVSGHTPGTTFDITTPTWRLGEAILEAIYIASEIAGPDSNLKCRGLWTGLKGRKLVSVGNPDRRIFGDYVCHQDTYEATQVFRISDGASLLPEIVYPMLKGMYELFGFFKLPKSLVVEELKTLQNQRF